MISKFTLVVLIIIVLFVAANRQMNHVWSGVKDVKPIARKKSHVHPSSGGCHKVSHRIYVIPGGSGFVGSWIARYLLMRGETEIHVLDLRKPPADLIKHGITFHEVDLTSLVELSSAISKINERAHSTSHFIFYNCSVVKRYDIMSFKQDLGLQTAEGMAVCLRTLTSQARNITVIHIGDSISQREPITLRHWLFPWSYRHDDLRICANQVSKSDTDPTLPFSLADQSRSFSPYAWYQGATEALVLSLSALPNTASGCIRMDGFVSGHVGDSFLGPAIKRNAGIVHSKNSPLSLIHVEDVARAAIALEYHLLDPSSRADFNGTTFSVGAHTLTTLDEIYTYIESRQPGFKVIHLEPIVVFIVSWIISMITLVIPVLSPPVKGHQPDSILCGPARTLTTARFSTLQVGQQPNPANNHRLSHLLKMNPNYTLSQIIDGVIDEHNLLSKRHKHHSD